MSNIFGFKRDFDFGIRDSIYFRLETGGSEKLTRFLFAHGDPFSGVSGGCSLFRKILNLGVAVGDGTFFVNCKTSSWLICVSSFTF